MSAERSLAGAAAALRGEFDRGFAAPPREEPRALEKLLLVRVGAEPYALRLSEAAALHAGHPVSALPSPVPSLLGVAGFRGRIALVYDLGALLGYPARAALRWLVLARSSDPIAFAFEAFEAQLSVAPDEIVAAPRGERALAREAVRDKGGLRPIVQLSLALEEIRRQASAIRSTKEA